MGGVAAGTSLVWQHLTNKPAGSHRVSVQAWFIIERLNLKKKKKSAFRLHKHSQCTLFHTHARGLLLVLTLMLHCRIAGEENDSLMIYCTLIYLFLIPLL